MYKIYYDKMEVAQIKGKREAEQALVKFKKQNPNSKQYLWRLVK